MRVLHLSTSAIGGAAIAGQRIHMAMREAGMDSIFASRGPAVGLEAEMVLALDAGDRWRSTVVTAVDQMAARNAPSFFSPISCSVTKPEWVRSLAPDVILVHNWFNLLGTSRDGFLRQAGVPVLFLLHDERLFTGGCHYSVGCRQFESTCSRCPQSAMWARQLVSREHKHMVARMPQVAGVVAPSKWLQRQAQQSHLFHGQPVRYIPNPIDASVFNPALRQAARDALGIDADEFVLVWQHGKGEELLFPLLDQVQRQLRGIRLRLLHTGSQRRFDLPATAVGELRTESERARFWAAGDLAFSLTAFDNFPNIVLEAMACGVPFVMPDVGGAGEAIERTSCGLVVPRRVDALAAAITQIASDADLHTVMSKRAVGGAGKLYHPLVVAEEYGRVVQALVGDSPR